MICRDAVEITNRSLDAPLSPSARVGLFVHRLFCAPCRRFGRQMRRLDALWVGEPSPAAAEDQGLSDAARQRIAAVLDQDHPALH